jgi:hypothetical protein
MSFIKLEELSQRGYTGSSMQHYVINKFTVKEENIKAKFFTKMGLNPISSIR